MSYSTFAICTFTWTWWLVFVLLQNLGPSAKILHGPNAAPDRDIRSHVAFLQGWCWADLSVSLFFYVSIYLLDTSAPCMSDSARLSLWVLKGQIIAFPLFLSYLCCGLVLKSCNFAKTCNKQHQQQQKGSSDQRMIRQCNVSINVKSKTFFLSWLNPKLKEIVGTVLVKSF